MPISSGFVHEIETSSKAVMLLHGVTGSGKTEVYLHLARQVLNQGKQVLILVPEISLTPQMVARVKGRFPTEVAIYHSALNNQQKYEQYCRVFEKQASIVVGTRSAVFMPFDHLGLIILDEEHDSSYKQDSLPQYHCRDIAIHRAQYFGCKVILGSANAFLRILCPSVKRRLWTDGAERAGQPSAAGLYRCGHEESEPLAVRHSQR